MAPRGSQRVSSAGTPRHRHPGRLAQQFCGEAPLLSFVERHVVASILGAVILAFLVYETSVRFFAYTGDAYVATDVIFIAPEVSGPLAKVAAADDAPVTAGAVLAEIGVAFITALVTDGGPPAELMPVVQRLAGIFIGVALMLIASFVLSAPHLRRHAPVMAADPTS
jgi:hypothetical protein